MRYIIILSIFLAGCATLDFSPNGESEGKLEYFNSLSGAYTCDICGEGTSLYRIDSRDRIWCNNCVRERLK